MFNSDIYSQPVGGFTWRTGLAGDDISWLYQGDFPPELAGGCLVPDLSDTLGPLRIIGAAIEVRDVSKVIVKGGTTTAYRQPAVRNQNSFHLFDGGAMANNVRMYDLAGRPFHEPPHNLTEATRYQDKKEWQGPAGIYQHIRFNSAENPLTTAQYVGPIIGEYDSIGTDDNEGRVFVPHPVESVSVNLSDGPPVLALTKWAVPAQLFVNAHQSGFIISGLDPLAKLRVSIKYAIEYEPDYTKPMFLSMSRLSSPRSSKLLTLIDLAMQEMPVAVPVDQNDAGDWFLGLVRQILKKGAPLVGMLPHPAAQGIATGMQIAGNLIPKPQKKQKKTDEEKEIQRLRRQIAKAPSPPPALPQRGVQYKKAQKRLQKGG